MNKMQAVNSAFVKLRRAVPLDSGQGKRVSKVVTTMVMVTMMIVMMVFFNYTPTPCSVQKLKNAKEPTRLLSYEILPLKESHWPFALLPCTLLKSIAIFR